jgi:hypothetical protein
MASQRLGKVAIIHFVLLRRDGCGNLGRDSDGNALLDIIRLLERAGTLELTFIYIGVVSPPMIDLCVH